MDRKNIFAWIIPIRGHAFDLEDLPIYLNGSFVTVVKREDGFFLQMSIEVTGQSYENVGPLAAEYGARINGAASVLIDGYRPFEVEVGGVRGIDDEGNIVSTVLIPLKSEQRMKSGRVTLLNNGVALPDSRSGVMVPLLDEAGHHNAKADALVIIGRAMPNWSELFVVFELVEANVGKRMFEEGWISRVEKKLFTRTANSYTALGRAGRHGRDSGKPPERPMSQREALALMRRLVKRWLSARGA